MGLKRYEVEIGNNKTTLLLSDEDAKAQGLIESKAKSAPANKAAPAPANKTSKK